MCGRFTLATPAEILAALFAVDGPDDWEAPRYNIAPRTRVLAVRQAQGKRALQSLPWGAINPRDSRPLINARSETVATSPRFARSFTMSRILVPADGFFEWTKVGDRRQARYFHQPGGGPFGFAGIAVNAPATGATRTEAAAILTTRASETVMEYHDRMPLIVAPEDFERWLDPGTQTGTLGSVIAAGGATQWVSHPVGPRVNSVRNDGPGCVHPVEPLSQAQGRLF